MAIHDSKRKMVVGILRPEATEPKQRELPKEPHLIQRLFQRLLREGQVQACYEAGVSGYDLYRQITACGVTCQVMAPALTLRRPGQRIKTDRRDAAKLVRPRCAEGVVHCGDLRGEEVLCGSGWLLLPDVTAFGLLAIAHNLLVPTLAVLVGLVIYVMVTTRNRIR